MRRVFIPFLLLVATLLVSACGDRVVMRAPLGGIPPAQQAPGGGGLAADAPPPPLVKPPGGGAADSRGIVVLPGDTVHSIAQRYQVPNRALIELNRLEPPYALEPGRVLILPAPQFHTVARGETLYGLSRRYRTDLASLARLNNLAPPYGIYDGQVLRLPGQEVAMAQASVNPPVSVPVAAAPPPAGGITVQEIPPASVPAVPATVPSPAASPPVAASPSPPQSQAQPPAAPQQAEPVPSGAGVLPPPIAPVDPPPPQTAALPPTRAGSGQFLWPAKGRLISGFGSKPGGQHNDGINIEVAHGAPVRAAESGTVIYAGNELKGYGNLLLVRHAGGWVTAYAHNDQLLVRRGAQVARGQVIAQAGSSGGVGSPQVHFEIRRGREAVDPMRYLGPPDAVSSTVVPAGRPGPG